jgi:UTP--glucose-1-phosphate uridylyltransferase
MQLTHAVIPAAGRGLKPYPSWDTVEKLLHPVIDRDGLAKPVLQILAEELLDAGIQRLVLVVGPGEEAVYRRQLDELVRILGQGPASTAAQRAQAERMADVRGRLCFVVQEQPLGLGHAVWSAREQVGGELFLLALSDHLFISQQPSSCAAQLAAVARELGGAVASVEDLPEHLIHRYGVVGGAPVAGRADLWQVRAVQEKPTPTQAELHLDTPGLRRGRYLCLSGMHVLPVSVLTSLDRHLAAGGAQRGELTPALQQLVAAGAMHALRLRGRHQDIGKKYGLLEAQLERSLLGPDREGVLAGLVEILARAGLGGDRT